MLVSWIDNNLIVGNETVVAETKKDLMDRFECKDCGKLNKYVGCKIDRIGNDAIKFTQPVLLQSNSDKFGLPEQSVTTPAVAGDVLMKCEEANALSPVEQTKYWSGVG